MTTTIEDTRAKRGDLVVIHCENRYYVADEGSKVDQQFTVGVVTSITRDGLVKGYREVGYGGSLSDRKIDLKSYRSRDKPVGFVKVWLTSQDRIDVPAALKAAENNTWHDGTPGKAFDSIDAVKAALKPHVREC